MKLQGRRAKGKPWGRFMDTIEEDMRKLSGRRLSAVVTREALPKEEDSFSPGCI